MNVLIELADSQKREKRQMSNRNNKRGENERRRSFCLGCCNLGWVVCHLRNFLCLFFFVHRTAIFFSHSRDDVDDYDHHIILLIVLLLSFFSRSFHWNLSNHRLFCCFGFLFHALRFNYQFISTIWNVLQKTLFWLNTFLRVCRSEKYPISLI